MWKCGRGGGRHRSWVSRVWCELGGVVPAASAAGNIGDNLLPRARAAPSAGLDCAARLRARPVQAFLSFPNESKAAPSLRDGAQTRVSVPHLTSYVARESYRQAGPATEASDQCGTDTLVCAWRRSRAFPRIKATDDIQRLIDQNPQLRPPPPSPTPTPRLPAPASPREMKRETCPASRRLRDSRIGCRWARASRRTRAFRSGSPDRSRRRSCCRACVNSTLPKMTYETCASKPRQSPTPTVGEAAINTATKAPPQTQGSPSPATPTALTQHREARAREPYRPICRLVPPFFPAPPPPAAECAPRDPRAATAPEARLPRPLRVH